MIGKWKLKLLSVIKGICFEMEVIPAVLTTTTEGGLWLRLNRRTTRGRLLIFVSDHGLKMLNKSDGWLVDGTFKVVCQIDMFTQFVCIMVPAPN